MKILFLALVFLIVAASSSCKKDDDLGCYHFTVKSVTDIIPDNDSTYPRTNYDEFDECEIDENEARQIQSDFTFSDIDTTTHSIIFTDVSCTYYKK